MFDRITFDPRILGGRASIRGIRISVSVIVRQIAHGATFDEVLSDYPDLEVDDVQQALFYAAWLVQGLAGGDFLEQPNRIECCQAPSARR